MAVVAEPNRRRLVELLLGGERSVSALAAEFPVSRSAISQHLGVLAEAGLVEVRKEGRFRYYRVAPGGLERLRASLDLFWTRELEDLAAGGAWPAPSGSDGRERRGVTVTLEKSVVVPLDPDATFAMLTEPERLRRWQAVTARIDLRAGGDYRWTITPGHSASGSVVEVDPGRRLVLSWGWEDGHDLPPGASTVTITLDPVEGGTLVRLVHEGLSDEQAAGHGQGWDHYLGRLAMAAAGPSLDAGPDDWAAAPEPIDELSAAEATAAVCQRVLRAVPEAAGAAPTPCASYDVDALAEHLLGSIRSLGAMAGAPAGSPADDAGPLEVRIAAATQQALEAWRRRGTDGEVAFGGGALPASRAASILSIEYLVHAWDFARATAQPLAVDESVTAYVLGLAHEVVQPAMRDGDRFAAAVDAGDDADSLARLVAFTGRTP
jgi:uncharacterized protein (TIGR03086 family)